MGYNLHKYPTGHPSTQMSQVARSYKTNLNCNSSSSSSNAASSSMPFSSAHCAASRSLSQKQVVGGKPCLRWRLCRKIYMSMSRAYLKGDSCKSSLSITSNGDNPRNICFHVCVLLRLVSVLRVLLLAQLFERPYRTRIVECNQFERRKRVPYHIPQ